MGPEQPYAAGEGFLEDRDGVGAAVELGEWLASLGEPGPAPEPGPDASGWSGPSPFEDLWKIL